MPPVTVFNLRREDPLSAIEEALRQAIKERASARDTRRRG